MSIKLRGNFFADEKNAKRVNRRFITKCIKVNKNCGGCEEVRIPAYLNLSLK
jgi:hypothetical protein